jgi:formylglycine-generating enzyme required for sulfatase activity
MVKIPGGSFLMGTEDKEIEKLNIQYDTDWFNCEKPQHEVTIKSFYMGKYPVTQAQWRAIANRSDLKINEDLDPNPANFKDKPDSDRRPVEQVNWQDAIEFCGRLSKLTGRDYRLPSEAEWEYACRAGTTTAYSFGKEINEKLANYGSNIGETTSLGKYPANQFGLYDMHGNVREWCLDPWHSNYNGAPTDGSVWDDGNETRYQNISKNLDVLLQDNRTHVIRGGSWLYNPRNCRSAYRFNIDLRYFNSGFRVVCAPQDL